MRREFKVEANVGKPQVAYRETIRRAVEKYDYTHKKQTGGSGQYAKVQMTFEPLDTARGRAVRVREQGHRWPHPARVHPERRPRHPGRHAARRPRRLPAGGHQGDPARRRRHDVDSSEMAFKIAGSMVLKEAVRKADPVLLEPIMAVEVRTPEDYMGDVIGDLNSRRGQIQAMEDVSGAKVVQAVVPLSEMFGYVGDLRSQDPGSGELHDAVRLLRRGSPERRGGDHQEGPGRVTRSASALPSQPTQNASPRPAWSYGVTLPSPEEDHSGQGEVRADEAARQHRHHRSHRPRQDDADGGDHQGAARQVPGPEPLHGRSTRSTRRPKRSSAVSRSPSRTSSTRPRSVTTRTSTARVTPTTSRT